METGLVAWLAEHGIAGAVVAQAAPDLPNALTRLLADIEGREGRTGILQMGTAVEEARAAIAKARGE